MCPPNLERPTKISCTPCSTSRKTSTPDDPDLSLVAGFPVSKQSLTRKFLRDLTGITGLKFSLGRVLMDLDVMKWTVANDQIWLDRSDKISLTMQRVLQNSTGAIATNLLLYGVLKACGQQRFIGYGLWLI